MALIAHLSDPHFGTEQLPVMQALQALLWQQAPHLLILSGDITQRARRSQFRHARAFVDSLNIPHRLVIPGNHDIPLFNLAARVLAPYRRHRHAFGQDLEPMYRDDQLLAITVNTTRAYRHEDGEVSPAQIKRVCEHLQQARPQQLRLVITHQPVYVTEQRDEGNLLHGYQAAVNAWAEAGADMILGGHIHLPFVIALHDKRPDIRRRIWAVQAGTAVSTRIRRNAGNSINLIRYQERHVPCMVERWDYAEAQQQFVQVSAEALNLEGTSS
ncbi:metallophosphoesterase [Methylovorus menthalis]|uniref:metallophosphoesterase family protein n=1 Tax=Methylovorus menthalis TaxID=1002227 RepID=UPI001E4DB845|nr:metallophosphoesterase [Methylovorus menthalis]MCB4810826.1 metallophosphoesterase [Methylovorus menthalis]